MYIRALEAVSGKLSYNAGLSRNRLPNISIPTRGAVVGRSRHTTMVTHNGEQDLFQFGNRTKLLHLDLPLLLCGQRLHDRRLDDGYQGHIRICCHCDGTHQAGLCPSFPARKMEVGPSAPPMMEMAAAALSIESHEDCQQISYQKYQAVLLHPIRKLMGFAINGPKSVIAPTPIKIREGKIDHSSNI